MTDERFPLSPSASPPPTGADYDAIFAAVMETIRGRWFLTEYAKRNRNADTAVILAAIERVASSLGDKRPAAPDDRLRADLTVMAKAIAETRQEIAAIRPDGDAKGTLSEATEELDSIVQTTARATSDILAAAEQVQEIAWTLRERGADGEACDALDRRATDIYTACSFQDLTGQRTRKVVDVLQFLEGRIMAMIEIWGEGKPLSEGGGTAAASQVGNDPAAADLGERDIDRMMESPEGSNDQAAAPVAATSVRDEGDDAVVWSDVTEGEEDAARDDRAAPAPAGLAEIAQQAELASGGAERSTASSAAHGDVALTLVLPDIPITRPLRVAPEPIELTPIESSPVEQAPVEPAPVEPARIELALVEPAPVEQAPTDPSPAAPTAFADAPTLAGATAGTHTDATVPPSFAMAPGADVARISAAADSDDEVAGWSASARLADDHDDILMPLPDHVSVADAVDELLMSAPTRLDVPAQNRPHGVPPPAPIELVTVDDTRHDTHHDTHDDMHHDARPAADVSLAAPPVRAFTVVPVVPAVVQPPEPETEPEHTAAMDLRVDIEPTALPTESASASAGAFDLAPAVADVSEPESAVVDAAPGVPQMRADEAPPPLSASSWQAPDSPEREEEARAATDAPAQQEPPVAAVETPSVDTAPAAAAAAAVDEDTPAAVEDIPAAAEDTPATAADQDTPTAAVDEDTPAALAEPAETATAAVDEVAAPAPAPAEPPLPPLFVAAAPPMPMFDPATAIAPLAAPMPPIQPAAVLAVPPKPAPPRRIEALAAVAALGEDEKVALFS